MVRRVALEVTAGEVTEMDPRYVVAIFWPPMAVWLVRGWGRDLAKNLALTLLGFYPGVIHAARIVAASETRSQKPAVT